MNINEVLKLADELLFSHTEKHLTPLQKSILEGILQDEEYFKIAEKNCVTQGHVQDIASDLWQILSQALGQKIRKANVCSILEKALISYHFSSGNFLGFQKINICLNQNQASLPVTESNGNYCCLDLDNAPEIINFYGRINELNTLKIWLEQSTHIISLFGITGIGKTSLALKLTEEVKSKFQYIIYRSFCFKPCFNNFLNDILSALIPSFQITDTIDQKVSTLMKFLRKNRCLIILDDIESLFECNQFAGQCQTEFEEYDNLFKQIANSSHQSCLLLISCEKPINFVNKKCLKIDGLDEEAKKILINQGLGDEENFDTLIKQYQGHPLWLETTAIIIKELFAGNVKDFLACQSLFLSDEIILQLRKIWQRLTEIEQEIIKYLSQQNNAVTLMQIFQEISVNFSSEIKINAIQSLKRRCLLDDNSNNYQSNLLQINPIYQNCLHNISKESLKC